MKKAIATIAIAGAATAASADFLSDLSIAGTFDYESSYIYRGAKLAQASFQPSVDFGYSVLGGDLYAGVWTNQPISGGANEIDFYTGYAYPVTDIFTVDAGFTYYWYPEAFGAGAINQTREIFIGASADVLLSPAVYVYYDFDLEQTVVEFSIGYSLDLGEYVGTEGLSFDTGAYLGILNANSYNAGMNAPKLGNGYTYGGITADLVYAFNENVSSSVGVRWSVNNDGDSQTGGVNPATGNFYGVGPANLAGAESQIWFGATLGFAY
ncbi:hypothetical protein [Cerasicoccus fimbriatus]|uniref:hypothetical protein n=1 Tax=Cerasicoccus fimbriatus TaxID=3014554 RepID=UPI0022B5BB1C|nr:hypothetical protein [Cerasicoccus sp. TK19100]